MKTGISMMVVSLAVLLGPAALAGAAGSSGPDHFMEQWDVDHDGIVTAKELREVRERWFLVFDANGDGYLDEKEYAEFEKVRAAGIASFVPEDRPKMLQITEGLSLAHNDKDGDGRVSRAEFLDGADAWLKVLDKDGDGGVTRRDLQ